LHELHGPGHGVDFCWNRCCNGKALRQRHLHPGAGVPKYSEATFALANITASAVVTPDAPSGGFYVADVAIEAGGLLQ
jgi:hypothetical protein